MRTVVVVGGGASGMISAIFSAKAGNKTILIEKNEKLGKKIYITGKGRCNITNACDVEEFTANVVRNPKFVFSAINSFSSYDLIALLENAGLKLKVERGKRVFPVSDKASDVTKTLEKLLIKYGVDVRLNTAVDEIIADDGKIRAVKTLSGEVCCDSVIVCTGGISYSATGSTGDGYEFAKRFGHKIVDLKPSLVGFELEGDFFKESQGLSLKNVQLTAKCGDKIIFSQFGESLFTHFGISGPIVLSCSARLNECDLNAIKLYLDFKPALDEKTLDERLLREFSIEKGKNIATVMRSLLPKSIIDAVLKKARISLTKKCSEISKEERRAIVLTLKAFEMKVKSLRPINVAIVTAGGVNVKEINPKTMESKIVKGLFFAGEVLDIDAFTGGFNLQLAFSTGVVAGNNA